MRCSIFLILLVSLSSMMLSANVMATSSSDLLNYCKSDEVSARLYCKGYIIGILEAGLFVPLKYNSGVIPFCAPIDGMKAPQLQMIVVKYLEEHPEELHYEPVELVVNALVKAFPCTKP